MIVHLCTFVFPDVTRKVMIDNAKEFYKELGIGLCEKSSLNFVQDPAAERLKHREIRADCDIGADAQPTEQEKELYEYKRPVTEKREIVVYFIQSATPENSTTGESKFGCAYRSINRPSILITKFAPSLTLAHEIGHVLGLKHDKDNRNNLMYPDTRFNVWPNLDTQQQAKVRASNYLFPAPVIEKCLGHA